MLPTALLKLYLLPALALPVLASCSVPVQSAELAAVSQSARIGDQSPYVYVFSKNLFNRVMTKNFTENINKQGPSNGAYTWSKGTMSGRTEADLVPVVGKVAVDVLLFATTNLNNTSVSNQRRVKTTFWSVATATSGSRKGTRMGAKDDPYLLQSQSNVQTNVRITGVDVDRNGLFSNMIRNRASQEVHARRWQIEQAITTQTASEINSRLDRDVALAVKEDSFARLKSIRDTIGSSSVLSSRLLLATSSEEVTVGVKSLASNLITMPLPVGADLSVRIGANELMMLANEELAGATKTKEELGRVFDKILGINSNGAAPVASASAEGESLLLDGTSPLVVEISNAELKITIKIKEIITDKTYKLPLDVTATYVVAPDGSSLVKTGNLSATSYDDSGTEKRMSRRHKIIAEELLEAMEDSFSDELLPKSLAVSKNPLVGASLYTVGLSEGYLVGGWKIPN